MERHELEGGQRHNIAVNIKKVREAASLPVNIASRSDSSPFLALAASPQSPAARVTVPCSNIFCYSFEAKSRIEWKDTSKSHSSSQEPWNQLLENWRDGLPLPLATCLSWVDPEYQGRSARAVPSQSVILGGGSDRGLRSKGVPFGLLSRPFSFCSCSCILVRARANRDLTL